MKAQYRKFTNKYMKKLTEITNRTSIKMANQIDCRVRRLVRKIKDSKLKEV